MSPVKKLQQELKNNKGVRIGQTAVVSRKVHTINPVTPQNIRIIVNSDAGQVFYHRFSPNEIIHIDLFHEIKTFNLKQLADFVKSALEKSSFGHLADNIDIQTGSGGGRLTGNLCYGKSASLRKTHLNHVHIAAYIPDEELESIFMIVAKIEQALLKQGVELRKIEKIIHEIGKSPMDLSSYTSLSDSNLKQDSDVLRKDRFKETVEMIEHFGSLKQIEDVLDAFENKEKSHASLQSLKKRCSDFYDIVKYFEEMHFMYKQQNKHYLTSKGKEINDFIKKNRRELESILKRTIKNSPKLDNYKGIESAHFSKKVVKGQSGPDIYVPYDPEEWPGEVNVPETIRRSMIRSFLENSRFSVKQQDFICINRLPKLHQDICLIIDASASMTGFRLRNAKYLAKHLVLRPHTRVSILAFQEKEVNTFVPFTRNYEKLENGLNRISATGLTPLALALEKGIEYMSKKNLKNPLIILITDGIPTVPLWTSDPINDAVSAAGKILNKKIDFCCIGLQPNKDCLIKITNAAKGKLYVLDELNREVLVEVARKSGQLL
ncbi:MAG: VWA domain-containing protein [Thermoanaerobacteraceae bacterium]|nr:VWA domain-containing protein [Thermoanaerobacteraceae bacterium]